MSPSRTVALLGGSFDPPHIGHVLMASWALCLDDVHEVWLLPTFIHPFGKDLSPFETRSEMCEAAIAHLGPVARVERIEQELGGISYTVRTLEALSRREPDVRWRWVGGADTWRQRHTWRDWDRLETMVEPLIIGREGEELEPPFAGAPILPNISSSDVRSRIAVGEDFRGLVPVEVQHLIQTRGLYR